MKPNQGLEIYIAWTQYYNLSEVSTALSVVDALCIEKLHNTAESLISLTEITMWHHRQQCCHKTDENAATPSCLVQSSHVCPAWQNCCIITEHKLKICKYSSAPSHRHLSTIWKKNKKDKLWYMVSCRHWAFKPITKWQQNRQCPPNNLSETLNFEIPFYYFVHHFKEAVFFAAVNTMLMRCK